MSKIFGPLAFNFTTKIGLLNFSEPRRDIVVTSNMESSTWVLIKSSFNHVTMCLVGKKEY